MKKKKLEKCFPKCNYSEFTYVSKSDIVSIFFSSRGGATSPTYHITNRRKQHLGTNIQRSGFHTFMELTQEKMNESRLLATSIKKVLPEH